MKSMTTAQKRNIIVAAVIAATLIVISLLFASCTAESSDGIEIAESMNDEASIGELLEEVGQNEIEEQTSHEDATEGNPALTTPSLESEQSSSSKEGTVKQATTQDSGSENRATPASNNGTTSSSTPSKRWVEDTQQVWVEDRAAWTEQIPVYSSKEVSICNVCGQDITGNTSAHSKAHMLAGEGSGHHSEVRQTISGYNTINHPAEGHYETKVVGGHWE